MQPRFKPLRQQTIVITGASSGIGLSTALKAASRGASVVIAARNAEALARICAQIRDAGGRAAYAVADVGNEADVEAIAAVAIGEFGGFDTWVNNAGVGAYAKLADLSTADHERIFRTNYWGVVFGSLTAVRHFRSRPGGGTLVNIGSVNSDVAIPLLSAYSASKHAVKGFTDALRTELMHERAPVSVTLIKPSGIATPFPQHARNYLKTEPRVIPPLYAPEIVADAILDAAQRPVRDIVVGAAGRVIGSGASLLPAVSDRLIARFATKMQTTSRSATRTDNLSQAGPDGSMHSPFSRGRRFSAYTAASQMPLASAGLMLAAAILVGRLAFGGRGPRRAPARARV